MNLAKNKFIIFILLFILQFILNSCDAPRTSRSISKANSSSGLLDSGTSTGSLLDDDDDNDDDDDSDSDDDSDDDDDSSSSISIPSGASHCQWSKDGDSDFQLGGAHFAEDESSTTDGAFNICQNKSTDTTIYFQIDNPISDEQLCMIPMFQSSTGNSTYLGEPRCFMATSDTKIYTINLYKNRTNFSSYDINGVMIMRDRSYFYAAPFPTTNKIYSVDAYLYCANYLAAYQVDTYCASFADGAHYVYHQFE